MMQSIGITIVAIIMITIMVALTVFVVLTLVKLYREYL